jgi:cytidylate kinase
MAVVTISRQYASGGDEIAARVCEILECQYFDKALMAEVASEIGLTGDQIVDLSEDDYQVRGFLRRLLGRRGSSTPAQPRTQRPTSETAQPLTMAQLDEESSIRMVRATIEAAYEQGDVVIVGRGGQAILQDKPGVLHVRIEAPLEQRVNRVRYQEMQGLEPGFQLRSARERIAERDRAAAAYLRRFYDVDWADPSLYHLVIDTAKWGMESGACLIAHAAGCLPAAH